MNLKQRLLTTAAAASAVFSVASAPAQAFSFGDPISFATDTTVDFTFFESHGGWKEVFGIKELATGTKSDMLSEVAISDGNSNARDFQGTCGAGKAVTTCTNSFTFLAGKQYTMFLDQIPTNGDSRRTLTAATAKTVYTAAAATQDALYNDLAWTGGPQKYQHAGYSTNSKLQNLTSSPFDLTGGEMLLAWEDYAPAGAGGAQHIDHNDFMLKAKISSVASVPEPATLAGLGLVGGALAFSRRRKAHQA
ncbi:MULTISPECIES: PEP-CTERM sorting domain-containing protein [Oscillatoriales]|uniref:PEP-CTERM sorting domain-containing protein n=1 Tax=Oscillatoriophycideae TaxID=1301283 RepID=UPI001F54FF0C|nr:MULTISPECIES: PEP-CTERM sorting domain-containing protein [Oscillatoriales]